MHFPPLHIVDPARSPAHATIILLHGRSSTATQFASDIFSHHTSDAGNEPRFLSANLSLGLSICWSNDGAQHLKRKKSALVRSLSLTDTNKPTGPAGTWTERVRVVHKGKSWKTK